MITLRPDADGWWPVLPARSAYVRQERWTAARVFAVGIAFVQVRHRLPRFTDLDGSTALPSAHTLRRLFGSLAAFHRALTGHADKDGQ
jgi:hypothetical protein